MENLPSIRDELFSDFLMKLNQVWHKREKKKIEELNIKHNEELRDIRRRISQRYGVNTFAITKKRQTYDDVVNLDRIEYLKGELKKARSPSKYRDTEGVLLDSTLAEVDNLSSEVWAFELLTSKNAELKRELRRLRQLLNQPPSTPPHAYSSQLQGDKDSNFLEGALWLGRKIVDLADKMGEKVLFLSKGNN